MTKMTTIPDNYNTIRTGIVELLKTARSAAAQERQFDYDRGLLGHWPTHREI